eukprot:TRINITY_DN543_c0_g1_i6.p1 TRINITY_DN543_c0_g1~~TRINITY_DN543_c0_g1_i6.p1  ORF type:complete len:283 (-),score=28.40 TRINITY_DN543_c0_g1_i6:33-842(-)
MERANINENEVVFAFGLFKKQERNIINRLLLNPLNKDPRISNKKKLTKKKKFPKKKKVSKRIKKKRKVSKKPPTTLISRIAIRNNKTQPSAQAPKPLGFHNFREQKPLPTHTKPVQSRVASKRKQMESCLRLMGHNRKPKPPTSNHSQQPRPWKTSSQLPPSRIDHSRNLQPLRLFDPKPLHLPHNSARNKIHHALSYSRTHSPILTCNTASVVTTAGTPIPPNAKTTAEIISKTDPIAEDSFVDGSDETPIPLNSKTTNIQNRFNSER